MKDKRILVTGGAGFIGSYLVEKLVQDGNQVVVVDTLLRGNKIPKDILNHVEFYQQDVCDFDGMLPLFKGVDCVFHFAAILGVDIVADNPIETMENETVGMQHVAKASLLNGVPKIMYASTSGVYGHHALEQSVTEEITIDPKTSYAMAKRFNEIYLAALFEEKGINTIALRFFNVFGERQDTRMVIPRFFEQAVHGKPLTVFGDGNQTRDFTWIGDTVDATIKLAETANGFEIFNISNETEVSVKTLAEKIIQVTGSNSKIDFVNAPSKRYDYEVERRVGSSDKLWQHVGFKPETTLEEGLEKMWRNFNQR